MGRGVGWLEGVCVWKWARAEMETKKDAFQKAGSEMDTQGDRSV